MNNRSNNSLVSIGMPVHNGAKTLERALDGIASQDYDNIEIIVSDNCSTDKTLEILEKYESKINIKIITQDSLLQIKDNFEFVLNSTSGEYFMWHAHDDYLEPEYVSSMMNLLKGNKNACVAQSQASIIYTNSERPSEIRNIIGSNTDRINGISLIRRICSPLKVNYYIYGLFKRSLLVEAFKHVPDIPSADRWFLLQFAAAGFDFSYIDRPLYIRSVVNKPLIERYPHDNLAQQIEDNKKKCYIVKPVIITQDMLTNSLGNSCVKKIRLFIFVLQFKYYFRRCVFSVYRKYIKSHVPVNVIKFVKKRLNIS